jgi:hypothetical protein
MVYNESMGNKKKKFRLSFKRKKELTPVMKVGRFISRLFEPIIEIPLLLIAATMTAYLNGYRWRFLALLLFLDAVIPGLYFLYLVYVAKKVDFDMTKREMRLPLYKVAVVSHLAGVLVGFVIDREPLAQILLAFWFLALIFTIITEHWKISLHAGVNSALATFAILIVGWEKVWWMIFLPIIVSFARVVYKKHTVGQVILGTTLPALLLPFFFWVLGV